MAADVRASIQAAIALLEAWADGPTAPPEPLEEAPADDAVCRHPVNLRNTKVATHGTPNAWLCRGCGFHYKGEPTNG